MKFNDFALRPEILQAVADAGYEIPTPIQQQAIPIILTGSDLLGIAQTGTGKTAAFVLPMIERLASGRAKARMPRSLILSPTRELATQTANYFATYGKHLQHVLALLIGGVMDEQWRLLERGVDVLIATGTPAGSVRARQGAARRRHHPGDRRGGPDARHGLHARRRATSSAWSAATGRR